MVKNIRFAGITDRRLGDLANYDLPKIAYSANTVDMLRGIAELGR
jgi:hypothetical protein